MGYQFGRSGGRIPEQNAETWEHADIAVKKKKKKKIRGYNASDNMLNV